MQLHRVEDDVRDIVDQAVKELGTEKVPYSGTGLCHGAGLVFLQRSHLDEFIDLGVWKHIFKFSLCHWVPWAGYRITQRHRTHSNRRVSPGKGDRGQLYISSFAASTTLKC